MLGCSGNALIHIPTLNSQAYWWDYGRLELHLAWLSSIVNAHASSKLTFHSMSHCKVHEKQLSRHSGLSWNCRSATAKQGKTVPPTCCHRELARVPPFQEANASAHALRTFLKLQQPNLESDMSLRQQCRWAASRTDAQSGDHAYISCSWCCIFACSRGLTQGTP